ncbi:sugar transferase [Bacillus canaveralius]|uniref:Sugar transferase n=1 Tax=Bacillus canaveralius TaxID=1403243 RepID=A0A2N5GP71_9BACI|nr:sugar transferase [Bacillus canaveralius]PLR84291.1 sugar transferase [Bacillus canaveralius]PLR96334.1 sugar transferase [Bacillus canaveralius]RSK53572.1 sugar transferase [Bacillus canaveralius]
MIDLFGSFLLILIFSPVLLIITIMILINMGSPVLFKQFRPGRYGKPFYIYKFRTMIDKRDENGNMLPGKLRLTKLGILLRKYSLDELPQLFNVMRGELSLVGPRPLLMEYLSLYTPEQARRHEVKPGITGWAQVNGRNSINWGEKFKLDIWYVNNQSIWLDLKIMALTLTKVFKKEGVSAKDHYSMERFKGMHRNVE